jgi:hypothetical protein
MRADTFTNATSNPQEQPVSAYPQVNSAGMSGPVSGGAMWQLHADAAGPLIPADLDVGADGPGVESSDVSISGMAKTGRETPRGLNPLARPQPVRIGAVLVSDDGGEGGEDPDPEPASVHIHIWLHGVPTVGSPADVAAVIAALAERRGA